MISSRRDALLPAPYRLSSFPPCPHPGPSTPPIAACALHPHRPHTVSKRERETETETEKTETETETDRDRDGDRDREREERERERDWTQPYTALHIPNWAGARLLGVSL